MRSNQQKRGEIKNAFRFLVDSYGFVLNPDPEEDIYAEVQYEKQAWIISIKTISHGTKYSLELLSPDGKHGFISHIFPLNSIKKGPINFSIERYAENLLEHGKTILTGDSLALNTIMQELEARQMAFIKSSGLI